MTEPSVTMYYGYDFKVPRERKRGRTGGGGGDWEREKEDGRSGVIRKQSCKLLLFRNIENLKHCSSTKLELLTFNFSK